MILSRFCTAVFVVSMSLLPAFAAESVIIDDTLDSKKIGRYIEYVQDAERRINIDSLISGKGSKQIPWKKSKEDKLSFGFSNTVYWTRFSFTNPTGRDIEFYLQQSYPSIDYLDLYVAEEGGKYTLTRLGYSYPFNQRPVDYRNFVFPITIKADSTITCFLRYDNNGSMNILLSALSPRVFTKNKDAEAILYWMFFGVMCVMFVYNLIIFISTRDSSYLYYVMYIASFTLFIMSLNGMAYQYLWPDNTSIGKFPIAISMAMIVISIAEFSIKFIDVKKLSVVLYKLFRTVTLIAVLLLITMAVFRNYRISINLANGLSGMAAFFCLIACVYFLIAKRSRQTVYFLSSFFLFFIGAIMMVLQLRGILPENVVTANGIMIGAVVQVVTLSFGLADRMNTMRKDLLVTNRSLATSEKVSKERADFLEKAVSTIRDTAEELIAVSRELSGMGDNFSQMSHDQASSSEQMSASFEELASSLETIKNSTIEQKKEVEKTASLMNSLHEAQERVSRSNQSFTDSVAKISRSTANTETNFQQMIAMMNIINEGGTQIGNFSSVIDDISDKINLLSLNASIEAARAGEYGRGFAVVADEIGKLAGATSDNSKQISKVISKITADIVNGMTIVDATKASTDSVLTLVNDINGQVGNISDLINNLRKTLGEVFDQSRHIDVLSKNIADATIEQSNSMRETMSMVETLATNAQRLQTYNERILTLTGTLFKKVDSMKELIVRMN